MSTPATLHAAQVNTSIMGMASAVFTSAAAMLVTTAIKSNILVEKTANVLIHGVSSAENIARAVEERSEIYGRGLVNNGALAERETTLRYELRLMNLQRQEEAVRNGAEYSEEQSKGEKFSQVIKETTTAALNSMDSAGGTGLPKITPAVPTRM